MTGGGGGRSIATTGGGDSSGGGSVIGAFSGRWRAFGRAVASALVSAAGGRTTAGLATTGTVAAALATAARGVEEPAIDAAAGLS
jgi:hypothetical protein